MKRRRERERDERPGEVRGDRSQEMRYGAKEKAKITPRC